MSSGVPSSGAIMLSWGGSGIDSSGASGGTAWSGPSSMAIQVRLRYSFCQFHQPSRHSSDACCLVAAMWPPTNMARFRVEGSIPASFRPCRYSGRNFAPPWA